MELAPQHLSCYQLTIHPRTRFGVQAKIGQLSELPDGLRTTAGIDLDGLRARYPVDLLAANDTLVARLVDEGRIVVRAGPEGGPWLVPTLSGMAVADGMAAAFDLSLPN